MNPAAGLTPRGWGVLAAALALVAGGFLFGLAELYPLAAAAAALVLGARAWVGTHRWDVRVSRAVRPSRVPSGGEARVTISLRNYGSKASPVLTVRDRFESSPAVVAFGVAPLAPGETRGAGYRLPATRRGMFKLHPVEIELCDPFGIARVTRQGAPAATLTVHPRVQPLLHRSIPSDSDRDRRVPMPVLGRGGDEFYGLREYQLGDDLRRIHWASTARVDELMVRETENMWRGRTTVAVDLRAAMHTPETVEAVLSAAATLTAAALRSGMQARVVTTAGADTRFGSGAGHEATVLDVLAVAAPKAGTSLEECLAFARIGGPLVLLTTDAPTVRDVASVAFPGGHVPTAVVRFESHGAGADGRARAAAPSGGSRHRVIRVPAGGNFAAAWTGYTTGARC